MNDENLIDPNEELDCYVGMNVIEVQRDLTDKQILWRVVGSRSTYEYMLDRVNLEVNVDTHLVTKVYYG